jgi:hypothetical protein
MKSVLKRCVRVRVRDSSRTPPFLHAFLARPIFLNTMNATSAGGAGHAPPAQRTTVTRARRTRHTT